jgi:hypothetical protein
VPIIRDVGCVLCGWMPWEHVMRPERCPGWIGPDDVEDDQ